MKERLVIYQVLPRLFGASSKNCVPNGSKSTNGCGRMVDFTKKALAEIHSMGVNCIWYTGMLSHASKTDYATYGIPSSNPELVKGKKTQTVVSVEGMATDGTPVSLDK